MRVALVSGRALADLRQRCAVSGCWYLGGHGNEWMGPEEEAAAWPETAPGAPLAPELAELAEAVRARLSGWPGAVLEVKPASVAIHCRHAPAFEEEIERFATEMAAESFRVVSGKRIVELLPLTARHKGHGVQSLRERLGCDLALYFGDDTTDEDVFRLHDPAIIGVHVGAAVQPEGEWDTRNTSASYWLRSPQEVAEVLRRLPEWRADGGAARVL